MPHTIKNKLRQMQPVLVKDTATGRSKVLNLLPRATVEVDSAAVTADVEKRHTAGLVVLTEIGG